MTASKIEKQQSIQPFEEGRTVTKRVEMKKLHSTYEAPTIKEFLWVVVAFALLIAFSWIAYYKLGWFH